MDLFCLYLTTRFHLCPPNAFILDLRKHSCLDGCCRVFGTYGYALYKQRSQQDSVGFVHLPVAEVGTPSAVCPLHSAHLSLSLSLSLPTTEYNDKPPAHSCSSCNGRGGAGCRGRCPLLGPLGPHHWMSPPLLPRAFSL